MAIADRILEALQDRASDGVTRSDLARACGVKPASVSQWVSGSTKSIRQDHLVKAADFLGVNIRWLAVGEGPKKLEHKEVWLDIGGLSPDRQAALRALLDTLDDSPDIRGREGNGH
jgi:transcriptional regulator with XRE-family HTH domain